MSVEVDIETVFVDSRSVACDGGGGVLGHPRVWVALDADGKGTCLYCGRRFVYHEAAPESGAVAERTPDGVSPAPDSTTPPAEPQG